MGPNLENQSVANSFHSALGATVELAWQGYAQSYDNILPLLPFYTEVVDRHVDAILATRSRTAVDVGAGTGNVTMRLAESGIAVSAVDTSPAMLAKLRAKCATSHSPSVSVHLHNAEVLDQAYPPTSFDAGTILLALYGMEHPRKALTQTMSLIRQSGILVITEPKERFSLEPLIVFVEKFLRSTDQYEILIDDWQRVLDANRVLNPEVRTNRLFAEEIVPQLEEGGFCVQSVKDSHLGNCATIVARKTDNG